jgi:predicted N-acetyltransferase YhbS
LRHSGTTTIGDLFEEVIIRRERAADRAAIAEVVRAAFVTHPDEVALFVERIRASEEFVPQLALVAGRAEQAGEPAVIVEGIRAYYPRFGFERASALGFVAPHPRIPDYAFMVKRLAGYTASLAGRIVYPAAFDVLGY